MKQNHEDTSKILYDKSEFQSDIHPMNSPHFLIFEINSGLNPTVFEDLSYILVLSIELMTLTISGDKLMNTI